MSNWKDKQNIGNLLKRVTEGLSEFETTWEKAHNAPSTNLKNKYEMELKKEIKKLQRYREQIKSWCQTNDVSSYKASLEESRSLIEREMERFQTFEKESKTKQYSKKALAKLMKKEKEDPRDETYKWIKEIQRRLTEQLEEFEEQMDTIGLKGKRGSKASKRQFDELHEKVKQHNWHIEQLEITSKRLKGGEITIKKVAKIREDVEYYVDSNQDPDFVLDEYLFDALDEDDSEDEDKENSEESRRESAEKGKAETALTEKPPQLAGSSTGAGGGSTATIHYRQQDYSVHVTNSPKSQKLKVRPKNDILKRKQNRERNSRELTRPSLKRPNEESPTTALTGNIHSAWGHKSMEKLSTPSHPNEQGAPKVFSPPAGQKSPGQDVAGWTPVMNRLQNSTNEATLDLKPIPGDKKLHPGSLTMPPENLSYMTSNRAYNSPISAKNFVSPRNYESFGRKERMNGVSTRSNDNGTRDDIGIDVKICSMPMSYVVEVLRLQFSKAVSL
mmetsp:Transcript_20582/g.33209  ORF Transcript_20582/g.33209 Transcript_20582/m.33209 type:complete len:501 (+) Transcript_20582:252-1754(+)